MLNEALGQSGSQKSLLPLQVLLCSPGAGLWFPQTFLLQGFASFLPVQCYQLLYVQMRQQVNKCR